MNFLKFLSFTILLIAAQIIFLLIGVNLVIYTFTNVKSTLFLILLFGLGASFLIFGIASLGMLIGKYVNKLNPYNHKGKKIVGVIMFVISLAFIILNYLNSNFEYTRTYFAFLIILGLAIYTPISLFAGEEE